MSPSPAAAGEGRATLPGATRGDATVGSGRIRIGVGGWVYEPWRGAFYPPKHPQKRELEYASRQLTSIEINGTYYGSQKPESFARWHDETPDDFVFALKAPRFTTVRRRLADAGATIERFLGSGIVELRDKLGPITWQFMPTRAFDPADFEAFLKLLPKSHDGHALRHAVEVRHPSFRSSDFVALARAHRVAIIVAGDSAFPEIDEPTADFTYARIMGTQEDESRGYAGKALDAWAERARRWSAGRRDVFLYVISGHKAHNPAAAMALIERVGRKRAARR